MRLAAAAVVLLLALAPTLYLLGLSVANEGYRALFAEENVVERQLDLLWRSFWISGLATILAVLWGLVTARAIRSLRGFLSAALETVSLVPLLIPSVVTVMGWIYFTRPQGPFAAVFGESPDIFRPVWAAIVLSMTYFPFVTVLALQGFRSIDPSWGTVARMHAGPIRTAWFIWRPMMMPYLATGGLLVFLLSFADYGVPWALSVNVYPVEIFAQLSAYYDIPKAIAFCAPPIAIAVVLMSARAFFLPPAEATVGHRMRAYDRGPGRIWIAPAAGVLCVAVVLPLTMITITIGEAGALTESWRVAGDNAMISLVSCLHGTWMLVLGGGIIAIGMNAAGRWIRTAGSVALMLPLAIPGAAVGLGIVLLYSNGLLPRDFFRSEGVLAYGMLCRLISFPALILVTSFAAIRPRMSQAARIHGVGPVKSFFRVSLPLAAPGLLAAVLISFIFCLGELAASSMINPPGKLTLAMRISSLLHFGEDRIVASLSLTLALLVLGVFLLGLLILNRRIDLNLDARKA